MFSGVVYAGGAQMASLGAWADPLPLFLLMLTTLAMNSRYLLLGAALRPGLGHLPAEVVTRISQALQKAGEDKAVVEQINATGCDVEILAPAPTAEKVRAAAIKWGKVIKDATIKAE